MKIVVTIRIIQRPDPGTLELLSHRMNVEARERIKDVVPGAIGLFQAKLPDLYFYADCAVKFGDVTLAEITGSCPQHVSTIALFGDLESVKRSLARIKEIDARGDQIEI